MRYLRSKTRPRTQVALLFNIQMAMRERDIRTRQDVAYPYQKFDLKTGLLLETYEVPPMFTVKFYYKKNKKNQPVFKISATRNSNFDEQYEIQIAGSKKIKAVMT